MRIYHTLGGQYLIHDREFSIGTIVLHLDNGIEIFCNKSNYYSKKHNLHVLLYLPDKKTWVQGEMKNKYTDLMWDYYKKNEEKINPKRIFKKHYQHKKNKHGTKRVTVPKSVQWSMKHPFQGGGVSPR